MLNRLNVMMDQRNFGSRIHLLSHESIPGAYSLYCEPGCHLHWNEIISGGEGSIETSIIRPGQISQGAEIVLLPVYFFVFRESSGYLYPA